MTEEEIAIKLVELKNENEALRNENENFKNTFRQSIEAIKAGIKAETENVERRMTDFLGDRLDEVSSQTRLSQAEIANIRVEFWGDKDRTVGVVNELSALNRKAMDYDRMHEEWLGVSGSEDKPGAYAMLNRLWLDLRDRSRAAKSRTAFLTGGGITFVVVAFGLVSGAIEKASIANAEKSKENEAKVTDTRKLLFALDKETGITFATIKKDIEHLQRGK